MEKPPKEVVIIKAIQSSEFLSRMISFDVNEINFKTVHTLTEEEIKYNLKGEPIYRNLYFGDDLAVKIKYNKRFSDVSVGDKTFNNEFVGTYQEIVYYYDDGSIYETVTKQGYKFILRPFSQNDEIIGVQSSKRWQILKKQRQQADAELATESPQLYKVLVDNFKNNYELYIAHGDASKLVAEIDTVLQIASPNAAQTAIQGFLNHPISDKTKQALGITNNNPMKVHELIKLFVQ